MLKEIANIPKRIHILESTLREGLQNEEAFVETGAKLFIIEKLLDAGVQRIEVGDFIKPDISSQFIDTEEILKRMPRSPELLSVCNFSSGLLEKAGKAKQEGHGPDIVNTQIATTEKLSQLFCQTTVEDRWKFVERSIKAAHDAKIKIQVTNISVWYCPYKGNMPVEVALETTDRLLKMGADAVRAADPYGVVTPPQAYDYFSRVLDKFPDPNLHAYHQHDHRGFGLANYVAAMQAGCTYFDTTLGGTGGLTATIVGGVPVQGEARYRAYQSKQGLVSTEDFLVLCDAMGIETGINAQKVLILGKWMERILQKKLWSFSLPHGSVQKNGMLK